MPAIAIIIIIVLALGVLFYCGHNSGPAIDHETLHKALLEYIKTDMTNFAKVTHPDGELFAEFYLLGQADDPPGTKCYLWVYCQEYYPEGNSINEGMGVSCPVALNIVASDNGYRITGHQAPRDGSLYSKDMNLIFPEELHEYRPGNEEIEIISKVIKKQAEAYFKVSGDD